MIDFNEIPQANTGNGDQDSFELFARDFFSKLEFDIIENPARGADNGRDLIIEETLKSKISSKTIKKRWLVSCKHYSHSKKSVSAKDEIDINDRIITHNCNGFIGFYSTIPNESLISKLKDLEHDIFDKQKIDDIIKSNKNLETIFKTYFPVSFKNYIDTEITYKPVNLFEDFFTSNEKYKNCILFNKNFKADKLYKGFILHDDFDEFLKYLGFEAKVVRFLKDKDKVGKAILQSNLNEMIDYDKKVTRNYKAIADEKVRKMIYEIDNPIKYTEEEISNIMQEVILDHKLPKKLKVIGSGVSAQRPFGFGIYFFTPGNIYFNIIEYRHTRNIFIEIKSKYFK